MPEQQVCGTGNHTHALELRAGDLVASLTVGAMEPEHVGLGAQAKMFHDSGVQLRLGTAAALSA
jgi:hypothetical protein